MYKNHVYESAQRTYAIEDKASIVLSHNTQMIPIDTISMQPIILGSSTSEAAEDQSTDNTIAVSSLDPYGNNQLTDAVLKLTDAALHGDDVRFTNLCLHALRAQRELARITIFTHIQRDVTRNVDDIYAYVLNMRGRYRHIAFSDPACELHACGGLLLFGAIHQLVNLNPAIYQKIAGSFKAAMYTKRDNRYFLRLVHQLNLHAELPSPGIYTNTLKLLLAQVGQLLE